MYLPSATYRVQLQGKFNFSDLKNISTYLSDLGIDTIYSAPLFQAIEGSNHGYDVVNPESINVEIGTQQEFESLVSSFKALNIGWLQDIVPNHMAYKAQNSWIMDIFEKGIHSEFYEYFDVDWDHPLPYLKGKILFPFLGSELEDCLKNRSIQLEYLQSGFTIKIYDQNYPAAWISYLEIIDFNDRDSTLPSSLKDVRDDFKTINNNYQDPEIAYMSLAAKESLFETYKADAASNAYIDNIIADINSSVEALKKIIDLQFFVPAYYDSTCHHINYRRFFVINDLICLKIENPSVFTKHHQFLKSLIDHKFIHGIRVDHIDGLYDPKSYLQNLRKLSGEDTYIVVEKILELEEDLPSDWPVEGTSGYEFLNLVNRLFTKEENEEDFTRIYDQFINKEYNYEDLVFDKKYFMLTKKMNGELDNLLHLIQFLDLNEELDPSEFREPLSLLLAYFPIYRTYITQFPLSAEEAEVIKIAFDKAEKKAPHLQSHLDILNSIFHASPTEDSDILNRKLQFVMRFQQFTSPLAAKGVEDTAFYIYNRLISHNEVGDSPKKFGISDNQFHEALKKRQQDFPYSINCTATHDTKRGEDARMRINVLSEMPDEWKNKLMEWSQMNKKYKQTSSQQTEIPGPNEEYFIYQSLLGGYPLEEVELKTFAERFESFMRKAMYEAKEFTESSKPNEGYENGTISFIQSILSDTAFMLSFKTFIDLVVHHAIPLSLSQVLIKITAPGIPDIYQGTELWDLSFVDPDNRREINFEKRKEYQQAIAQLVEEDLPKYLHNISQTKNDGRVKFYTTMKALLIRKQFSKLFHEGSYTPLRFEGAYSKYLIGFARQYQDQWCIVIAPKSTYNLNYDSSLPIASTWGNTYLILPENAPTLLLEVYSNQIHKVLPINIHVVEPHVATVVEDNFKEEIGKKLLLEEIFNSFPIALLINY